MGTKDALCDKRGRGEVFFYLSIGLCVLFLCSCVATGSTPGRTDTTVPETAYEKPALFQSKDYVICELTGGETPEGLAQRFLGDSRRGWVITENNPGTPYEKGQRIIIPLKEERRGGLTADGYQKVPILVYHTFAETCKSSLCLPREVFDKQMAHLKDRGYHVIPLSDLIGFLEFRTALPEKAVVITIDDGYRSVYDIAFPILRKYGFTATLFVYMDFIGIPGSSVTWDQLKEMKENGFEVGSHTVSHCNLTKRHEDETEQAYLERIEKELVLSKRTTDERLHQDTISLAFPYGAYNQEVLDLCEKAGYRLCLSVKRGGNPFFALPLALGRSQLLERDIDYFIKNLDTFHEVSLR